MLTGIAGMGLGALVLGDYSSLSATILLVLGIIVFVFGLLEIVYGVGFLHGEGWSWTLAMVIAVASLVSSIAVLGLPAAVRSADSIFLTVIEIISLIAIIPIITSSVTIYGLTRPQVKAFFGKGLATTESHAKPVEVN